MQSLSPHRVNGDQTTLQKPVFILNLSLSINLYAVLAIIILKDIEDNHLPKNNALDTYSLAQLQNSCK